MRLESIIKKAVAPLYRKSNFMRRLTYSPRTRGELHEYWRTPDSDNDPESYLVGQNRSQFLVSLFERYMQKNVSILEVGCNVGRNLNALYHAGYMNLTGIEINPNAIEIMGREYPDTKSHTTIHNSPVEDVITHFRDGQFDAVFTMAVLEHIHGDSEWIFEHIARITKYLITIEDEKSYSWRHFPRNYKKIFEGMGMVQIGNADEINELTVRVFERRGVTK